MKLFKTLLAAGILVLSTSAMAQETDFQFKKHAFINLQGGASETIGETKWTKLITPAAQIGLGYQWCPLFSTRLAVSGWQSKGAVSTYDGTKTFKWNYVSPEIDFMFDLSNAFCGFNPKRVLDVTAFLGGGLNVAWGNDDANDIATKYGLGHGKENMSHLWDGTKLLPVGRGGIQLGFRLSDAVSFLIEGNANIINDHYNSKHADNPDWYFNALAGFRINLGKTYTKKEKPAPEPEPAPVVEEKVEPAPAPAPVVEEKIEPLRRDVFFTINSTQIRDTEAQKVKEVVDYLNKYPNAKVNVTGYADAGTGNDVINDRIAAKRAAKVVNELTTKYGIPADRITSDSKGARVQPFAENDKNRVSICIAE